MKPSARVTIDLPDSIDTFHRRAHYRESHGFSMRKLGADLRRYRRIIRAAQPQVVVETGTRWGGSALWFHDRGCRVITIDTRFDLSLGARTYARDAGMDITWLHGSSTDPGIFARVRDLTRGLRTMVSLDSDHHFGHVADEIGLYGSIVSIGCHLVVEDGIADLMPDEHARIFGKRIPREGGPLKAINRTLANWDFADPAFLYTQDMDVETMFTVSHSPGGWWRRVE